MMGQILWNVTIKFEANDLITWQKPLHPADSSHMQLQAQ